jgi:hypothetical protein
MVGQNLSYLAPEHAAAAQGLGEVPELDGGSLVGWVIE